MAHMIRETDLIAQVTGLTRHEIRLCVESGWLVPAEERDGERLYLDVDVARARLIHELRDDLALGEDAVPVVLSLIDQLHTARFRLHLLLDAVRAQPEDHRTPLLETLLKRLSEAAPKREL